MHLKKNRRVRDLEENIAPKRHEKKRKTTSSKRNLEKHFAIHRNSASAITLSVTKTK